MVSEKFALEPNNLLFVIIDMQEKLANSMKKDVLHNVIRNIIKLTNLCKIYSIPIIITEQNPLGLGKTLDEIKILLDEEPVEKMAFSCVQEEKFLTKLNSYNRKKVILAGMEAHVCVWQTALDLLSKDYFVYVLQDAVCSRRKEDWKAGLDLIKDAGGIVSSSEIVIFQVLKMAGTPEFKKMLPYLK